MPTSTRFEELQAKVNEDPSNWKKQLTTEEQEEYTMLIKQNKDEEEGKTFTRTEVMEMLTDIYKFCRDAREKTYLLQLKAKL